MKKLRKSRRGYTVVEVLAAMTLFAIGAAGVFSMQKVTIQGGDDARHFDVAANIAQQWGARMQRDAMFWTQPNAANPSANNIGTATYWLKDSMSGGVPLLGEGLWLTPTIPPTLPAGAPPTFGSGANSLFGQEVAQNSADLVFCTQYRESWIVPPPALGAFLRVEIRVAWPRIESAPIAACNAALATDLDANPNKYHFVYLTTAIRENP